MRAHVGAVVRPVMRLLDTYPNAVLPVKAALAALVAWLVVKPADGFIDDYQYYAPLGAVVTVTPVLAGAVRSGAQTVLAVVAGGLIAILVHSLPLAEPVAIAVAVAAGVACSLWKRLGSMGSWVPFVSLFALLLHSHHPWHYVAAYVLLAGAGALVGLAVGFLFPQVPTGPALSAERQLSEELAHALEVLGDALSSSAGLNMERQHGLSRALHDRSQQLRAAVRHIDDARRFNWRAARADPTANCIADSARHLQVLTDAVAYALEICGASTLRATDGGPWEGEPQASRLRSDLVDDLRRAAESLRDCPRGASAAWSSDDRSSLARLRTELASESLALGDELRLALVSLVAGLQRVAGGAPGVAPGGRA